MYRKGVNMSKNFRNSRTKIFFFVCVILSLAVFFAGCSSIISPTSNPDKTVHDKEYQTFNSTIGKYSVNVTLEQIPEKILIYTSEKSNYSCEWGNSLSKRLLVTGECLDTNSGFVFNKSGQEGRELGGMSNVGEIWYNSDAFRRKNFPDKDKPQNLPSDDQVIRNVTEFLKSQNLLFSDAVYVGVGHAKTEHLNGSKAEVIRQTISVFYTRELNDRKVLNSQIRVEEGEDFDIISLFVHWRNYSPYKEVPTKQIDTAFREFTNKTLNYNLRGEPEKIVVSNVSLVYYSQVPAAAESEKYLQPVYFFEGYVQIGNAIIPFDPVYIPATIELFEKVPGDY
jgi:hypothetical protein